MTRYTEFYQRSLDDRDGFWREQAQLIDWQRPHDQICDYSHPPFATWFVGGKTNLCHNAVDRHLKDRADQSALIWVSTETGQEVTYSFAELHAEVQRMAASLLALGVQQGDRVLIYMPMIAEAAFAMLACTRLGYETGLAHLLGNQRLTERNVGLDNEVRDLRQGLLAVEERARYDLGMLRPDEIFVQFNEAPAVQPARRAEGVKTAAVQ